MRGTRNATSGRPARAASKLGGISRLAAETIWRAFGSSSKIPAIRRPLPRGGPQARAAARARPRARAPCRPQAGGHARDRRPRCGASINKATRTAPRAALLGPHRHGTSPRPRPAPVVRRDQQRGRRLARRLDQEPQVASRLRWMDRRRRFVGEQQRSGHARRAGDRGPLALADRNIRRTAIERRRDVEPGASRSPAPASGRPSNASGRAIWPQGQERHQSAGLRHEAERPRDRAERISRRAAQSARASVPATVQTTSASSAGAARARAARDRALAAAGRAGHARCGHRARVKLLRSCTSKRSVAAAEPPPQPRADSSSRALTAGLRSAPDRPPRRDGRRPARLTQRSG